MPHYKIPKKKTTSCDGYHRGHLFLEHNVAPCRLSRLATPEMWKLPELPGTILGDGKWWRRGKEKKGTIDIEIQAIKRNPHTQNPPDSNVDENM